MDKKSFLRGFGTGMLLAVIVLGISFSIRTSESATVSRAKKLGMVFESNNNKVVLATPEVSVSPETSESPEVSATPEASNKPEVSVSPEVSEQPSVSTAPKASDKPEVSTTPKASKKPNTNVTATKKPNNIDIDKEFENKKNEAQKEIDNAKKQLTINDGDESRAVSKKLESLGIIDSAFEFDKYLIEKGYSFVINSGTYDVSPEDSFYELAEKITSRFK